jgi:hypothetical protein
MPTVEMPDVATAALVAPATRPMLLPTTDGLNLFVRRWIGCCAPTSMRTGVRNASVLPRGAARTVQREESR